MYTMYERKKISAVIFDIDGTLFDTKNGILQAIHAVSEKSGYKKIDDSDELSWIGLPIRDTFLNSFGMDAIEAEKATNEYRRLYIEQFITSSYVYDGVQEVLEALKRAGLYVAVATMKTDAQVRALLNAFPTMDLFDWIETASEEGGKTKADMIMEL